VKHRVALATCALLTLTAPAGAQHTTTHPAAPVAAAPLPERPWAVGERLEYGVKFGFFNVGRATLEVLGIDSVRGEPCWHIRFVIHGSALGYTLDDSLQSWFSVNDLASRRFEQHTNEDGRLRNRHYDIFPERREWVRDSVVGPTPADPLDDASFFFYARTLQMDNGRTFVLDRYFQRENNPVTIHVIQRQNISVPAGRFRSVAVRPVFRSKGLFGQGGQAIIWFSDDDARIPVRIRTSLIVGTLDMSLRSRN
jgi:hypothetical protein